MYPRLIPERGGRIMEKRSLHLAIGIVVVFMFFAQGVKTAGQYFTTAGQEFNRAEEGVSRVGKKIAGIVREVTAYNVGVREQTSDAPCIGASGRNLCKLVEQEAKVCAANFVPLGTILKIEEYGMCVVLDRMHKRFSHRVDIAMKEDEIEKARRFGLQKRAVEAVH
jgi:3D (Asp-Asp-Asp) domain-containing protein